MTPSARARVNVSQTLALIEHLLELGIHVLFLSTNQVFDGTTPNVPAAAPHSPVSEYGRQKAQVEAALCRHIDRGAPVAILRLAKVVSPHMALINGWIEALSSGLPIQAFDDMRVAPTPIELVTGAIAALLQDRATGIFQLTGPRDVTYADIGHFLADRLNADPAQVTVAQRPLHPASKAQRLGTPRSIRSCYVNAMAFWSPTLGKSSRRYCLRAGNDPSWRRTTDPRSGRRDVDKHAAGGAAAYQIKRLVYIVQ